MKEYLKVSGHGEKVTELNELCVQLRHTSTRDEVDVINELLTNFTSLSIQKKEWQEPNDWQPLLENTGSTLDECRAALLTLSDHHPRKWLSSAWMLKRQTLNLQWRNSLCAYSEVKPIYFLFKESHIADDSKRIDRIVFTIIPNCHYIFGGFKVCRYILIEISWNLLYSSANNFSLNLLWEDGQYFKIACSKLLEFSEKLGKNWN